MFRSTSGWKQRFCLAWRRTCVLILDMWAVPWMILTTVNLTNWYSTKHGAHNFSQKVTFFHKKSLFSLLFRYGSNWKSTETIFLAENIFSKSHFFSLFFTFFSLFFIFFHVFSFFSIFLFFALLVCFLVICDFGRVGNVFFLGMLCHGCSCFAFC